MSQEFLSIVDDRNRPLRTVERSEALKLNLWRRAAGGLIIDPLKWLVLCQRRACNKDQRGGLWIATFGGKLRDREPPRAGALRELQEELGLTPPDRCIFFVDRYKIVSRRQFEYVYAVVVNSNACTITPQVDEVSGFMWVPISDCLQALRSDAGWFAYGYDIDWLSKIDQYLMDGSTAMPCGDQKHDPRRRRTKRIMTRLKSALRELGQNS